MTRITECQLFAELVSTYVEGSLPTSQHQPIERHLAECAFCREGLRQFRAVQSLAEYVRLSSATSSPPPAKLDFDVDPAAVTPDVTTWQERLGSTPWWLVSFTMHILIIALASLISMTTDLPRSDDGVTMQTELQRPAALKDKEDLQSKSFESALESKLVTPTDPASKDTSAIMIPPDILAKADLGDHFETVNPDRMDTHSADGIEEARMFHDEQLNANFAGGGGTDGPGMDDVIGRGGAGSRGTGGGFGGGEGFGIGVTSGPGGGFGQRNGGGRKLLVRRYNGSKATESAVDKALEWLAYHQESDGHWDSIKYGVGEQGQNTILQHSYGRVDTAVTGLALLAFLGAGHTEKLGHWKENVQRAVAWLRSKQAANGLIYSELDADHKIGFHAYGYSIAIATMALSEAAGMARVPDTQASAQKAVDYCTDVHQDKLEEPEKGSWYYLPGVSGDISNSGWFIMALKSAKVARLHVNPAAFEGAIHFLNGLEKKVAGDATGYGASRYNYHLTADAPWADGRPCACAIGNLCRQYLGWKKNELEGSVELFVNEGGTPQWKEQKIDLYFWYYGTLCTFQQGGDLWKRWNEDLKKALTENQCKQGDEAGSWPVIGQYSSAWGRVGQTAVGALCLEVYYRYLQLTPDK